MSMNHRDTIIGSTNENLADAEFARVHRVTVVDLVSEGPIGGLCEGLKSVYLNDDPLDDRGTQISDSIIPDTAAENEDPVETTAEPTVTFNGTTTVTTSIVDGRIQDGFGGIFGPDTITVRYTLGEDQSITGISRVVSGSGAFVLRLTKTGTGFASLADPFPFTDSDNNPLETFSSQGALISAKTGRKLGFGTFTNISGNSVDFSPVAMGSAQMDEFISASAAETNDYFLIENQAFVLIDAGFGTNTLTTANNYTQIASGTYKYTAQGTLSDTNNPSTGAETGSSTKIPGTAAEFRTGDLNQLPLTNYGGVASGAPISIGNGSNFQTKPLEFKDSNSDTTTEAADPAQFLGTSSAGFNLTPAQAKAVDEVELTFSYNSLVVQDRTNGNKIQAAAAYEVTLEIIRNNVKSFVPIYAGPNNLLIHKNVSTSPITNLLTLNLTPFKPFDDFNVIVERKTRFDGLGVVPGDRTLLSNEIVSLTEDADSDDKRMQGVCSITRLVSRIYTPCNYPLSAVAQVAFTSKNFPGTPTRTYECFGRKVKIPSNYTPRPYYNSANVAATYTGLWDGTFRGESFYTDNPAWVFYDILTNNTYGLGDWISPEDVDIYSLYRIAKYCDELVPDGKGGQEPRYRANIYLTKAADAYKVVKDMATNFLGLLYWMNGKITTVADQAKDPIYVFNKTNTINGDFVYEGTGSKTRANQIVVSWNNPRSNYRIEPLIVEDSEDIANTGRIISEEAMAFGCTSEGQATRYGRWKLWTSKNQTELVKFSTSIDAAFLTPGDVITIQDNDRYNTARGGRIARYNPVFGKTADVTYAENASLVNTGSGGSVGFSSETNQNFVASGSAVLPRSFSADKCLFEFGNQFHGMWLGVSIVGGVPSLYYTTGGVSSTNGIAVSKPISEIPEFDNASHTITWEVNPGNNAEASVWIDGIRYLHGKTSGGGSLLSDRWAPVSGADGSWGKGVGQAVNNLSIADWPATISSDLSVYNNSATGKDLIFLDRAIQLDQDKTYTVSILMPQEQDATQEGEERPMKTETKSLDSSFLSGLTYVEGIAEVSYLQTASNFSSHAISSSVFVLTESSTDGALIEGSGKNYKIMTIGEQEQGQYTIVASEYSDAKYASVESEEGFTLVRDATLYPTVGDYDKVPPVRNLKAIAEPDVETAGNRAVISWDVPLNDNGTDYNLVAAYEIHHNISERASPIVVGPGLTSFVLKDIVPGNYQIRVQAMNAVRNRSMPRVDVLNVFSDDSIGNITRGLGGVGIGGKITKPIELLSIGGDTLSISANTKIYAAANPLVALDAPFTGLNTNNAYIPPGNTSVLLDADERALKSVFPYIDGPYTFWVDAIASEGGTDKDGVYDEVLYDSASVAASYNPTTQLLTGSINGGAPKFTETFKDGDFVVPNTNIVSGGNPIMKIISIISDTVLKVENGGTSAISSQKLWKPKLRVDNKTDTIVGTLNKTPNTNFVSTLTHNPVAKNSTPFQLTANQPLDVRMTIHALTDQTFVDGYIGSNSEVVQAMPDTLTLGLEYRRVGENSSFEPFPNYNQKTTYSRVIYPTTSSSSFTVTSQNSTGSWEGTRKKAIIVAGGAATQYTTSSGATLIALEQTQDIHLDVGTYEFRAITEFARTYTGSTVPGAPTQDSHLNDKGDDFVTAGFFNDVTITTTGTENTSPLTRTPQTFSIDNQILETVHSPAPNKFTTEMTVDRNDVDILQPTDELVYHWQFNDILGSSITESIEGQDGEAES